MFIGLFYIYLINKLCEKEIKYSWWGERFWEKLWIIYSCLNFFNECLKKMNEIILW